MQTNNQPVGFRIISEPNVWLVIYAFPCLYTWLISHSIFIRLKDWKKQSLFLSIKGTRFAGGKQATIKKCEPFEKLLTFGWFLSSI